MKPTRRQQARSRERQRERLRTLYEPEESAGVQWKVLPPALVLPSMLPAKPTLH